MEPSELPLRDLHLPDAVGWWPLAPGWWGGHCNRIALIRLVCIASLAKLAVQRATSSRASPP